MAAGHAGPGSDLRSSGLRPRHRLRRFGPILPPLRCGQMVARTLLGLALRVIALRATVGLRSCFVLIASGDSAPQQWKRAPLGARF